MLMALESSLMEVSVNAERRRSNHEF
jgi:hypothetical protein